MATSSKDADWKVFKQIKENAIAKFCEAVLSEYREVIDEQENHPHNRVLLIERLAENRRKQMKLMFEAHSRSKMNLQLYAIRAEGLADDDMLKKLSDGLLKSSDPSNV